ncbi:hypothetical protein, partial [Metallibacterium sp.]
MIFLLQLQLSLTFVALASVEQHSRARGKGAPVRAHGWASSRWARRMRRAPASGWRRPDLAAKQ